MARQISDVQKAAAVRRVQGGESKAAVARSLGVSGPTVTNWINAANQSKLDDESAAAARFAPPTLADVAPPACPGRQPVEPADVTPPPTLAPVPGPQSAPTPTVTAAPPAAAATAVVDRAGVCGHCRPPQGVHPDATSFTCAHGTWKFAT
jgi:hypothetical protein